MSHSGAGLVGHDPGLTGERVKVPLLAELLAREMGSREMAHSRRVWVDLGGVQSGLVERLAGGRNRLIVADLGSAREDADAQWHLPGDQLEPAFRAEPIDCYLCWDLLNYMGPEQLGDISRHLAHRARPGCSMHALIQYSGTSMSPTPGRYRLNPDGQLSVVPVDVPSIKTPRYSPKALEKAMPELRVERTMLLNNGMQEFLFILR